MAPLLAHDDKNSATSALEDRNQLFPIVQDLIYEQLAKIGKAFGNKQRLKLLELLAQTERSVESLSKESGLSVANVSQHLNLLRNAGLVEATKHGLYVYYRLSCPEVLDLLRVIRTVANKRLGDLHRILQTFLSDPKDSEPLTLDELLERLRRKEVILIDVRPREEYLAGHIPGALSIPLNELTSCLSQLPKRKEIVAYCRGPFCLLADRALEILRKSGRKASRLKEGFPEWRAAKLPIATGNSDTLTTAHIRPSQAGKRT